MVELIRAHGADYTQVIGVFLQTRQAVGNPLPTLSRLMKWILRSQQLRHAIDECKAFTGEKRSGAVLPVEPGQFWFMFEEFQLARRSGHVQIDHTSCFRSELWRQNRKRRRGI